MTIDYDSLERMHKQEPWTADQQRHFEHGWEAGQRALAKAILNAKEEQMMDLLTYANPVFEKPDPATLQHPPFYPITVEAASQWLHADLEPEVRMELEIGPPSACHHSVGRYLRNKMGLWTGNDLLRKDAERFFVGTKVQPGAAIIPMGVGVTHCADGLLHPDEVSNIIIKHLQAHLKKVKEIKS